MRGCTQAAYFMCAPSSTFLLIIRKRFLCDNIMTKEYWVFGTASRAAKLHLPVICEVRGRLRKLLADVAVCSLVSIVTSLYIGLIYRTYIIVRLAHRFSSNRRRVISEH